MDIHFTPIVCLLLICIHVQFVIFYRCVIILFVSVIFQQTIGNFICLSAAQSCNKLCLIIKIHETYIKNTFYVVLKHMFN